MSKIQEVFLPIPGFNGIYEVSNLGIIRSANRIVDHPHIGAFLKKGKTLSPGHDTRGYLQFNGRVNGGNKSIKIHTAVALCFIPNPENKRTVNHKDGNKENNKVDNLEWATYSENSLHAFRNGLNSNLGMKNKSCKLSEKQVLEIFNSKEKNVDLAIKYKVGSTAISAIKTGYNWTHITGLKCTRNKYDRNNRSQQQPIP